MVPPMMQMKNYWGLPFAHNFDAYNCIFHVFLLEVDKYAF